MTKYVILPMTLFQNEKPRLRRKKGEFQTVSMKWKRGQGRTQEECPLNNHKSLQDRKGLERY